MLRRVWGLSGLIFTIWALTTSVQPVIAQESTLAHVVQPGDTLLDLQLFYNASLHELEPLNEALDISFPLSAGETLNIPVPFYVVTDEVEALLADGTPFTYIVQRGDTLFRIAARFNVPVSALVAANQIQNIDSIYTGQELVIPGGDNLELLTYEPPQAAEAPPSTVAEGKQIVVSLSQQQVFAYEDGVLIRQFVVSTGLPGTPTVTGNFAIYVKYVSQRMSGPGYDLPNVPWVMYFYRGYALHGTYWHNNFGQPMSHGCVNMRTPEAEWLYNWAPIGTPVRVVN